MPAYDAFISYSHAKDKALAAAVQAVIQKLGKPWYRRRALHLFRDDTSLSATPALWSSIERALSNSRYFILLASPEAAASQWVAKEVAYWLASKGTDTLLIGLTHGELLWDSAANDFVWRDGMPLPHVLAGRFASEPKWIDLRELRDLAHTGDSRLIESGADFAAAIRGVPKEDLLSQEVHQQRRALTLAWSAVALLVSLAGAAAWLWHSAITQRDRAEAALARAEILIGNGARHCRIFGSGTRCVSKATGTRPWWLIVITCGFRWSSNQETPRTKSGSVTEPRSHAMIGDALFAKGDHVGALKEYESVRSSAGRLLDKDPRNRLVHQELSESHRRIGDVFLAQRNYDVALTHFEITLQSAKELVSTDRSNIVWQEDLAIAHQRKGDALRGQGQWDAARAEYQAAVEIADSLLRQQAFTRLAWKHARARNYGRIGSVLAAQNRFVEARAALRDCLAFEPMAASFDLRNSVPLNVHEDCQRQLASLE